MRLQVKVRILGWAIWLIGLACYAYFAFVKRNYPLAEIGLAFWVIGVVIYGVSVVLTRKKEHVPQIDKKRGVP